MGLKIYVVLIKVYGLVLTFNYSCSCIILHRNFDFDNTIHVLYNMVHAIHIFFHVISNQCFITLNIIHFLCHWNGNDNQNPINIYEINKTIISWLTSYHSCFSKAIWENLRIYRPFTMAKFRYWKYIKLNSMDHNRSAKTQIKYILG